MSQHSKGLPYQLSDLPDVKELFLFYFNFSPSECTESQLERFKNTRNYFTCPNYFKAPSASNASHIQLSFKVKFENKEKGKLPFPCHLKRNFIALTGAIAF